MSERDERAGGPAGGTPTGPRPGAGADAPAQPGATTHPETGATHRPDDTEPARHRQLLTRLARARGLADLSKPKAALRRMTDTIADRTSGGAAGAALDVPSGTPESADRAAEELGATVAALTADDIEPARRRQLLTRLVGLARARGLADLFKPKAALRWMTDTVSDVAPHIPVRDLATLRRHFPGLDDEALAERLVRNAARATSGVGAAGGGVAAVEWVATPTLLSAPVLLAAETVAVVAIELKLIGELHEVYHVPLPTGGSQRAIALMQSWANQRGINPMTPGVGVGAVLGTAARRELRDTLLKRFGRNLTTLGPFLTGAAVASYLNGRATRTLADEIRRDLRRKGGALPGGRPALP